MKLIPHTFENCLSGALGEFWVKDAQNRLDRAYKDLQNGDITIDENGVARNCIGRILMSDLAEVVSYVTDKIDLKATAAAREVEVSKWVEEYRKNPPKLTTEDLYEMRSAFGKDTKIVDIFTNTIYYT